MVNIFFSLSFLYRGRFYMLLTNVKKCDNVLNNNK